MADNNTRETGEIKQLEQMEQAISRDRDVGGALRLAHRFLDTTHKSDADGSLAEVQNDYELMKHYMLMGLNDPQRDKLYNQLLERLYTWLRDRRVDCIVAASPVLAMERRLMHGVEPTADETRGKLETYVTDMAMLSLEPEDNRHEQEVRIRRAHYAYLDTLFMAIVTSHQWSHDTARQFADVVLAPSIDYGDALLLATAMTMATLLEPDAEKTWALMYIYRRATSEPLCQRALVGWVFALANGNYGIGSLPGRMATELLADPDVRDILLEMQMQVVYCQNTERDNDEIQRDVIPTLLKNQDPRMARFGIGFIDETPMDEVLHPDEADKRMEKIEQSLQRMADMRKKGVDIYFGGFAQMKRFAFFRKMSNWFVPFNQDHPDLPPLPVELQGSAFLDKLFGNGPFCESDKYSFVIGLSSVFARLPAPVRDMLAHGGAEISVLGADGEAGQGPGYVRRMYLQDLYRFFKISDNRSLFSNPFGCNTPSLFFATPLLLGLLRDKVGALARFLLKHKRFAQLKTLCDVLQENPVVEIGTDGAVDVMLAKADLAMYEKDFKRAARLLARLRQYVPDDAKVLRSYAMTMFRVGHYKEASDAYRQLGATFPKNLGYALGHAIALTYCGRAAQAVEMLYKLDYEHAGDGSVRRALAWALLCDGRAEQAMKMYDALVAASDATPDDWLNAGYAAWLGGDRGKACHLFARYVELADPEHKQVTGSLLLGKFKADAKLLWHYGVGETEMKIMADC